MMNEPRCSRKCINKSVHCCQPVLRAESLHYWRVWIDEEFNCGIRIQIRWNFQLLHFVLYANLKQKGKSGHKSQRNGFHFPHHISTLNRWKKVFNLQISKELPSLLLELLCRFVGFESWIGDEGLVSVGWESSPDSGWLNLTSDFGVSFTY